MKIIGCLTQRRGNALRFLFALTLIILPVTLSAQWGKTKEKNEELGPVGRTGEIINVMWVDLSVPPDQFSFFLAGHLGIYTGEPYYYQGVFIMLPSGAHSFLVTPGLVDSHVGRFAYSAPDNAIAVDCVLEPGKFYTFNHDKINALIPIGNAKNVSVVELSDREGEDDTQRIARNFKEFVEYYTANSGVLEGTYVAKNGKSRITFTGDRFTVTISSYQHELTYEGSFRFNGETIIASFESQTRDFRNDKKTDLREDKIWYYKKEGDVLELDGSLSVGNVRGTYTKTAE